MADLNKCPECGGPADNGHDRCVPPNPYECSCCMDLDEIGRLWDIHFGWLDNPDPQVMTGGHIDDQEMSYLFDRAREAIGLRREKYKTEDRLSNLVDILSREWCVKIYMHNEPMPSGCRSKTDEECHECWMKELGF
ncbi:MAG: hypothetical protein ACWGQW_03610 [bacterium]